MSVTLHEPHNCNTGKISVIVKLCHIEYLIPTCNILMLFLPSRFAKNLASLADYNTIGYSVVTYFFGPPCLSLLMILDLF